VTLMDFSKLDQNEKLAVYGAAAGVVGMVIASFLTGIGWLTLLAGLAMLVIIFLPQSSPTTNLPGSKGSLMVLVGGIGAAAGVLALLTILTDLGGALSFWPLNTIFLLIGVAGGLLMGWAGWQAFQAEGGKFQVGTSSAATPPAAGAPPSSAPPTGTPESTGEVPQATTEAPPPPPPSATPPSAPPSQVPPSEPQGQMPPREPESQMPPSEPERQAPPPSEMDRDRENPPG
jgi:hypothetical protein